MNATVTAAAVSGVFVMLGALLTYRQSQKAARDARAAQERADRQAATKVDAEAYQRAREIDQGVVNTLREELSRAQTEIDELRVQLTAERNTSKELRDHIDKLERSVSRMRRYLAASDLDVPPDLL